MPCCEERLDPRNLIIYHISPSLNGRCHLNKTNDVYADLKPYWGDIIIYPATHCSNDRYAYLLDKMGRKAHPLTKETFQRFKKIYGVRHIYVNRVQEHKHRMILDDITRMSPPQLREVIEQANFALQHLRDDEEYDLEEC